MEMDPERDNTSRKRPSPMSPSLPNNANKSRKTLLSVSNASLDSSVSRLSKAARYISSDNSLFIVYVYLNNKDQKLGIR